jgi:hypothetical protein
LARAAMAAGSESNNEDIDNDRSWLSITSYLQYGRVSGDMEKAVVFQLGFNWR